MFSRSPLRFAALLAGVLLLLAPVAARAATEVHGAAFSVSTNLGVQDRAAWPDEIDMGMVSLMDSATQTEGAWPPVDQFSPGRGTLTQVKITIESDMAGDWWINGPWLTASFYATGKVTVPSASPAALYGGPGFIDGWGEEAGNLDQFGTTIITLTGSELAPYIGYGAWTPQAELNLLYIVNKDPNDFFITGGMAATFQGWITVEYTYTPN